MDCVGIRTIQISSSNTNTSSEHSLSTILVNKQSDQHDTSSNTPGMVAFFHTPNDEFNIPQTKPSSMEEESPVIIQILVTDGLKSFHGRYVE